MEAYAGGRVAPCSEYPGWTWNGKGYCYKHMMEARKREQRAAKPTDKGRDDHGEVETVPQETLAKWIDAWNAGTDELPKEPGFQAA